MLAGRGHYAAKVSTDPAPPTWARLVASWAVLLALVVGTSLLLRAAGLPSPELFGSLLGGLLHALTIRPKVALPKRAFTAGQAAVGAAVGSSLDFDSVRELGSDWPAVLVISVATVVVSVVAGQALRIHAGVTPVTATFASIAGGASGMVALAHDLGADDRVVSVVQYLRVLVILLLMPGVVAVAFSPHMGESGPSAADDSWQGYALAVLAAGIGLVAGRMLRFPSPGVLGPLLAWPLLGLLPVFDGATMPLPLQVAGFALIGVQVGLRFTPESLRAIGRMLGTAMVMILVVIAVCAGLGLVLSALTGASTLDGYLATTPGGLYAVLGVATAASGDVTFVTASQLIRLLVVLVPAPFIARWWGGRRRAMAP